MQVAFDEAQKSLNEGGIPIGVVLVRGDLIIGRGHNRRVQENNPILHAEVDCIRNAGRIRSYKDMVMYTTLMPCYFCGGAVVQFGISKVVSGETKHGVGSREFMKSFGVEVEELNIQECIDLMDRFIRNHADLWQEDCGVR